MASGSSSDDASYLSLMNSMEDKVTKLCLTLPCNWSIYKVPRLLRQLKEDAYSPGIVSIGPFHYGQEKLQAMEAHKIRHMDSLFKRTPDPKQTSSECGKAVLMMEESARHCYSEHQPKNNFENGKLAEILLVDGCFILEVLLRWRTLGNNSTADITMDPIFGSVWMINCLQRDLFLLENQIPFSILKKLFDLIVVRIPNWEPLSLNELCVLFHLALNLNEQASQNNVAVKHLLDVVRNYYIPSYPKTQPKSDQSWDSIHCATKLRDSGIKFVKGSSEQWFDIKFDSTKGELEIPLLLIQDATELLLRNLIAFEQFCHGTSRLITSYAMLMDRLIDSPRDAEFLEQKRIIANHLGNGEDVSQLFNNMFKEVVLEDFFFEALCEEVNEYYNRRWPRYKAFLARNHCSNPWRIMSIVAAFVLLGLAAVQTGYTAAGYYPH